MFSAEINTYHCHSTGGTLYKGMLSDKGHIILVLSLKKDNFSLKDKSLIWVEDKTAWREVQMEELYRSKEYSFDSTGQKSATVVIPRIYLPRTLTQDPQAMIHKRYLGKNLKDRAIWSGIFLSTPFLKNL